MTIRCDYPTEGQILKWVVNPEFCIGTIELKAATSDEIYPGMAMRDNTGYIAVANGQEANCTAIALERITATGGETIKALVRGPALIDSALFDYVQDTYADANVSWAELVAASAAITTAGGGVRAYPVNLAATTGYVTQAW